VTDLPDSPDELDVEPGDAFEQLDDEDASISIEHAVGVDHFGTTAEEQLEGESLDKKLSEEVPDDALDPEDDDVAAEVAALEVEDEDTAFAPIDDETD
jgi:hypothetical protein